MLTVSPGMDVARQRRKITTRAVDADDEYEAAYLVGLLALFDAAVAAGTPRPAREFLLMWCEEFDRPEPR